MNSIQLSIDFFITCSKCHVRKDFSEFHRNESKRTGFCDECKVCRKDNKQSNRKRDNETRKKWRYETGFCGGPRKKPNLPLLSEEEKRLHVNQQKRIQNHRRRARLLAGGNYTQQEWDFLCIRYGNICLCCKSSENLTVDHVIPLSKGGANTIDNIQPLCFSCNVRKQANTIDYRKVLET